MYIFDGDALHRLSFDLSYLDLISIESPVLGMNPNNYVWDKQHIWDEYVLQELFIDELLMHKQHVLLLWQAQFGEQAQQLFESLIQSIQSYLGSYDFHPSWAVRIETPDGLLEITATTRQLIKKKPNGWRFWDAISRAGIEPEIEDVMPEWVFARAVMQAFIHPKMYNMQEQLIMNKVSNLIALHFKAIHQDPLFWKTMR